VTFGPHVIQRFFDAGSFFPFVLLSGPSPADFLINPGVRLFLEGYKTRLPL